MATQAKQKIFGIFEGGGLKGIALAGAYEAVCNSNFEFIGYAGASAGAIVAALAAAGAKPEFIRQALLTTNLQTFLDPDFAPAAGANTKAKIAKLVNGGTFTWMMAGAAVRHNQAVRRVLLNKGIHSGDPFVVWFKEMLKQVHGDPDVRFGDIKEKRLKIIATDLGTRRLKVFSAETDAKVELWRAVRASMSIPFFFHPVAIDNSLYVDGGLLSNFPAWVFDDERKDNPSAATVGFRLRQINPQSNRPDSLEDFVLSIWEAMLVGDDQLQYRGIRDLVTVNIDSDINWLAFDVSNEKKEELYKKAVRETKDVLSREFPMIALAPKINGLLKQAAMEMLAVSKLAEEPLRKRIRANIMAMTKGGTHRKVVFSYNMEGDTDAELELEMTHGEGGYTLRSGEPHVSDLAAIAKEFREGHPDPRAVYNMTQAEQDLVRKRLASLLCIPIAAPTGELKRNQQLYAVLSFDSDYTIEEMQFNTPAATEIARRWAAVFAVLLTSEPLPQQYAAVSQAA